MHVAITVRNMYFIVKTYSSLATSCIDIATFKLTTHRWDYNPRIKKMQKRIDKVYLAHINHDDTYHFNINMLKDFMLTLAYKGISREDINITLDRDYPIMPLDAEFSPDIKLRDYQQQGNDILVKNDNKKYKLVDLATGKGKGILSIHAMVEMNRRTLILILPRYVDKWVEEITEVTDTTLDEIAVLQGSSKVLKILDEVEEVGVEDLPYKFIILTTNTMYNFIKDYEQNYRNDYKYPITPMDLTRILGVGTIVNDETHQQFHSIFRSMLFLDGKQFIGLTATLVTKDKSLKRMYDLMFPGDARISNLVEIDKYINVYAVRYSISNTKIIQYKRPQGYNHNLFESSMLRRSRLLHSYIEMVLHYLKEGYIKRRVEKDKCLIFVASVNMATLLTNKIRNLYPNLVVNRYVEDDPYENIMEADITVSTHFSSGTAYDLPNLITVLQTVSLKSIQANKQNIGRLRNLKGKEMRYYYFYCKDIPNHLDVNRERIDIFNSIAKSYNHLEYQKQLLSK